MENNVIIIGDIAFEIDFEKHELKQWDNQDNMVSYDRPADDWHLYMLFNKTDKSLTYGIKNSSVESNEFVQYYSSKR